MIALIFTYHCVALTKHKTMTKHDNENPLKRITVNLDQADYLQMERIAKTGRVSTAWLIRKAISEFLERQEDNKNINITIKSTE